MKAVTGRPHLFPEDGRLVKAQIPVPKRYLRQFDAIASSYGTSRAHVMRDALTLYLETNQKPPSAS